MTWFDAKSTGNDYFATKFDGNSLQMFLWSFTSIETSQKCKDGGVTRVPMINSPGVSKQSGFTLNNHLQQPSKKPSSLRISSDALLPPAGHGGHVHRKLWWRWWFSSPFDFPHQGLHPGLETVALVLFSSNHGWAMDRNPPVMFTAPGPSGRLPHGSGEIEIRRCGLCQSWLLMSCSDKLQLEVGLKWWIKMIKKNNDEFHHG